MSITTANQVRAAFSAAARAARRLPLIATSAKDAG